MSPAAPDDPQSDPDAFERALAARDEEFQALTPLGGAEVRVRFTGPFEGGTVLWEARLVTLEYARQAPADNAPARSFIEIPPAAGRARTLTVGLAVAHIDRPTILKTIKMIRRYKRLRVGRHEFGRRAGD